MMTGRRHFLGMTGLALAAWTLDVPLALAQKGAAVSPEVAASLMLRLTYRVRDVDATARFWSTLGATRVDGRGGEGGASGGARVMSLGGLQVALMPGMPTGDSVTSVVNHIAFRVPNFDALQPALMAAGIRFERPTQFPGTLNAYSPEGDKVEIFDNNSTSPGFTVADGVTPVGTAWQRHNAPVTTTVSHHLHFYVPEGQERAAQQWYLERFGGVAGIRLRYAAVDYPGINLNFSNATPPAAQAPTAGRSLDRIGFIVRGVDDLCRHIAALGTTFTSPLATGKDGVSRAVVTDPWGTTVEISSR